MIRHVAFDFDGTLVRSNRIKRDCFYETLAGVPGGAGILDQLFASRFAGDRFALYAEVARRVGEGEALQTDALVTAYGRLCRARIAAAPEVPGAGAALARLVAGGARLSLVSATPQQALEEVVSDRGLTRYFDAVLGAPTGKAAHLRAIMGRHGLGAADIAVVGDGLDDQAAAAEIGCLFVAVTDQPNVALITEGPSLPDLCGLPALLGYPGSGAVQAAQGGGR